MSGWCTHSRFNPAVHDYCPGCGAMPEDVKVEVLERENAELRDWNKAAKKSCAIASEEIARLKAEREWQPIETAPKGSGVDGPCDTRHPDYVKPPRVLLWIPSLSCASVGSYDWYYHDGYGAGYNGMTAWVSEEKGQQYDSEPTHWMPLPEPPKGDKIERLAAAEEGGE